MRMAFEIKQILEREGQREKVPKKYISIYTYTNKIFL